MPVSNIIDRRENHYDINIMAVFESSWADNNAAERATQFDEDDEFICVIIKSTTIDYAIKYANQAWSYPVTLYLYDAGISNNGDYQSIELQDGIYKLVK